MAGIRKQQSEAGRLVMADTGLTKHREGRFNPIIREVANPPGPGDTIR